MINYRRISLLLILCSLVSASTFAQSFTNSPYTRYGIGDLDVQGSAKSRAMGGTGYAIRDNMLVNFANPASYSTVDSLTFLFDGGFSYQNTNFSNGTIKKNARTTGFDYLSMEFRAYKGIGVSIGLIPLSHVGYQMGDTYDDPYDSTNDYTLTYAGDGGLQQVYMGVGVRPFKPLSVGVNVSYLFGTLSRTMSETYESNSSIFPFTRETDVTLRGVKVDIGMQYTQKINKKNSVTIGAVFSPQHTNIHNTVTVADTKGNSTTGYVSSSTESSSTIGIPSTLGIGLAYQWDNRLTVAADYTIQPWSKVAYMGDSDAYCDRSKFSFGVEYLPNYFGRHYLQLVKYRAGFFYDRPYYKINNVRACTEFGVTAGFSLPLPRNNSRINISGQYVHTKRQISNCLTDRTLRLCVGITFNERWFFKRKVN